MDIPRLYETDDVPMKDTVIYQKWEIPQIGFYWLIAELNPEEELAFGYANLNDDPMAEWGLIPISELRENGARPVEDWKPVKFKSYSATSCYIPMIVTIAKS